MKRAFLVIAFLLIGAAVFELLHAIKQGRIIVPEDVFVGQDCGCDCILDSRPWYSRFNYWFWLWVFVTPIIVFSVKPSTQRWQRTIRTVIAVGFCYAIMNLALHLMWDIRNGPFVVNLDPDIPDQKTWNMVECANIADGASLVFTLLFGWVYASIYTGWWEMIWYQYHKRKTLLINKDFKRDWISRVVVWVSATITILMILTIIFLLVAFMFEKFS